MRPDLNATETGVFFFMEDLIIARSFFFSFFVVVILGAKRSKKSGAVVLFLDRCLLHLAQKLTQFDPAISFSSKSFNSI